MGLIRVVEAWFDQNPKDLSGFDLVHYHQCPTPHAAPHCLDYYTMLVDLDRPPEDLLAGMRNGNPQQIRRAITKDQVQCTFLRAPSHAERDAFQVFCQESNPGTLLDRNRLEVLAKAGMVALSAALTPDGTPLVWHAYICPWGQRRVRCDLSASIQAGPDQGDLRNLVGRANRLLHYQDMVALRTEGITCYDFGGWYPGTDDLKRLNINRFKEGFGGTVVREYETEQPLTRLGELYQHLRFLKWRWVDRDLLKDFQRRRLVPEE